MIGQLSNLLHSETIGKLKLAITEHSVLKCNWLWLISLAGFCRNVLWPGDLCTYVTAYHGSMSGKVSLLGVVALWDDCTFYSGRLGVIVADLCYVAQSICTFFLKINNEKKAS